MKEDEIPELEEVDQVEEVEPEPQPGAEAGGEGEGDGKEKTPAADADELKRYKAEAKAYRERARESDASARYWAEQARLRDAGQPHVEKPQQQEDDLSDVDLVELITTQGAKGLETVMQRMGYAKRSDVLAEVTATKHQISAETALMQQYPELADDQSPLFLATAKIYNQLATDPAMKGSPNLIQYAARTAKAELALRSDGGRNGRNVQRGAPQVDEFDDEDVDQAEEDRIARAGRQSGDRGRQAARRGGPESEQLNSMQLDIVRRFAAAGAPLTEDIYRRHAKAGVRMGGVPTRRAA